ncbi:MAG: hypothetical protein JXL84_10105 [Deltaproteobacteria bacterium]|nr:hypothetical protein [Deltaproteobacteria bacterium]
MALILAINEEKDSLTLAERILRREGHLVVPFVRAQEAMDWLKGHSPDVVLASGGWHGEKAKDMVDVLKRAGIPGAKILLLTGQEALVSLRKTFQHEVRGVIQEPAYHDDLLRLVNSVLKERSNPDGFHGA